MPPWMTMPGAGAGEDGRRQVVAGEGAVADFAEYVDDDHIAFDQRVDDPRVLAARAAFGSTLVFDDLVQVGSQGCERGGNGSAHENALGVQIEPVALELEDARLLVACLVHLRG